MSIPKIEEIMDYFYLRKWILLAYAWCLMFALGVIGFYDILGRDSSISPYWDFINKLYMTIQLAVLQSSVNNKENIFLEISRWGQPLVSSLTIMLYFLGVAKIELRLFSIKWLGHIRRFFYHGDKYYVVSGLDRKGTELIKQILARQRNVTIAVIDKDFSLFSKIKGKRRVIFIEGDMCEELVLKKSLISKASQVFLMCPDDMANLNILAKLPNLLATRKKGDELTCNIHISSHPLKAAIEDINGKYGNVDKIKVIPFNIYDYAAKSLIRQFDQKDKDASKINLIIVGFGRFGRALTNEIVTSENFELTGITVFDKGKDKTQINISREMFLFRYPKIKDIKRINFLEMEIDRKDTIDKIKDSIDRSENSIICICVSDSALSLSFAIMLNERLHGSKDKFRIFIRTEEPFSGMFKKYKEKEARANLFEFSPLREGLEPLSKL